MPLKLLFICSRNQWRSRTAEELFRGRADCQVKSAGTAASARIRVSEKQIEWADLIFVMEKKHGDYLREKFGDRLLGKPIINLWIPDDFAFNDPDLIALLAAGVEPYLQK